jgi:hypothetical protein
MSDIQILVFAFLFLFAGTAALFPGRKLVRRIVQLQRLNNHAVRPVADLTTGESALVLGTATGEPTPSPVSGTPCLFGICASTD